jgi:crotonobetainyl-CoA:carnitine CoA-transferase CaiB-like acyl-CoA transferase
MAEMGAEVWKVEPPKGDIARGLGVRNNVGMGSVFLNGNRGKQSIVVDLKKPAGRDVVQRLAGECDVFLHTMRSRTARRLEIDYDSIKGVNPRVVYCEAFGYGQEGPYRDKPAYDDVIQAVAGFASLQGGVSGEPSYVAQAIVDKTMGVFLVSAITAALFNRERTGQGQSVSAPMFETTVWYLLMEQFGGLLFDPPRGPSGYPRTASPYRRPYKTSDGYISLIVYTDRHWDTFFELVGKPARFDDVPMSDIQQRTLHIDELYAFLEETMLEKTTADWLQVFETADIPAAPVHSLEDLLEDPHLRDVGFFQKQEHPTEGTIHVTSLPIGFSSGKRPALSPAPRLGEHTQAILSQAGYDADRISELVAGGVVNATLDVSSFETTQS